MVERKAIVLINGLLGSIPDGDSLNLPALTSSEINFDGYISFNSTYNVQSAEDDLININYNNNLLYKFSVVNSYSLETESYTSEYIKFASGDLIGINFSSYTGEFIFSNNSQNFMSIIGSGSTINNTIESGFHYNIFLPQNDSAEYNITFRPSFGVFSGERAGSIKFQFRDSQSDMTSGFCSFEQYIGGNYVNIASIKPFDNKFEMQTSSNINFNIFAYSNAETNIGVNNGTKISLNSSNISYDFWNGSSWDKLGYIISESGSFYFVKDAAFLTSDLLIGWNSSGAISINADTNVSISTNNGESSLSASDALNFNIGALTSRAEDSSSTFYQSYNCPARIEPILNNLGAGYNLSLSGGKGTSGFAGGNTIIGSDNGGTPGTDLAGNVLFDVGSQVASGFSAYAGVRINGTDTIRFYRSGSFGTPVISSGHEGAAGLTILAQNLQLVGTGYVIITASTGISIRKAIEYNDDGNRNAMLWERGYLATSSSGAQTVWSYNMSNNMGYDFVIHFSCTNKTDKVTSSGYMRFTAQNNAGTGGDNGAATNIDAASIPASEAGLAFDIIRSGTQVQARLTTPDTDSRECRVAIHLFPVSLV